MSLIIIASVGLSSHSFAMDEGLADKYLQKQIEDCNKNTAKQWDSSTNRCVGKVEAIATRNEAKECNAIADIEQRKACHLNIAQKNSGLNADPNSLNQGNLGKSAIMNGIGSAYAILGFINSAGESGKNSTCTSKKIFGYTALAGTVTDIWLKIRSKKKMNALADKYQLDKTNSPYEAQVRALYYLKEEQQTVADIAAAEKKRNLLLTLGYGAASAMAIFEIATSSTGGSTHCWQKEVKTQEPVAQQAAEQSNATAGTETVRAQDQTTGEVKPTAAASSAPADGAQQGASVTAQPAVAGGQPAPTVAEGATAPAIRPNSASEDEALRSANDGPVTAERAQITATTRNGVTKMSVDGQTSQTILVDRVLDSKGNVIGILDTKNPPPTIDYSGPPQKIVIVEQVNFPGKSAQILTPTDGPAKSMRNIGLDYTGNGGNKFLSGATKVQYTTDGSNKVNVMTNSGTGTFKPSVPSVKIPAKKGP